MNRIELNNRAKAIKILTVMGFHAVPIENSAQNSAPDLNAARTHYTSGEDSLGMGCAKQTSVEMWIEFKIVEEWPKRATTCIRIDHFTAGQKAWFRLRLPHNPNCFIMVQIEEDHLLYHVTPAVLENLGTSWNKQQMYDNSISVCKDQAGILDHIAGVLK